MNKLLWYLMNIRNLCIAIVRIFFYCLMHPQQMRNLLFMFFSTINEFYQSSHGGLRDFETTNLYKSIKKERIFARSNIFNMESVVTRMGEAHILATLTSHLKPKNIFEIGTYNGFTTLHFAYNSPEDARIYTLDLPPDFEIKSREGNAPISYDDILVIELSKKNIENRIYKKTLMENKIVELFGDSTNFDYKPYAKKMDLIFIDGNHSYAFVKSDTENALKMLSNNGVIVWHDFDYIIHRDVFKYLNALSKEYSIYHVRGTRFAIYGKNL